MAMVTALVDMLGSAAVIALSPIPVIATILMLLSPRARINGPAFLLGWFVGIVLPTAVFTALSGLFYGADNEGPQPVAGILKVALAAVLLVLALGQWRGRPRPGEAPRLPEWMASIEDLRPPGALRVGAILALANPKNLVLSAAGGVAIGAAKLTVGATAAAITLFAAASSLLIIIAVASYLVEGERMAGPLDRLRAWLTRNNAVVMAIVLLVFGVLLLAQGIAAF